MTDMTQESLFNTDDYITNPGKTCRHCEHRERWKCGGSVIQYCGVRSSGRTFNDKLKIKVTNQACGKFEQNK